MNLEEAKSNIGKEVVLNEKDGNFKLTNKSAVKEYGVSYKMTIAGINHHHVMVNILAADGNILEYLFARPEAIKLKEQPMQNYKIKVTPDTSAEAQELFFELGYSWQVGRNKVRCYLDMKFIYVEDGIIFYKSSSECVGFDYQEITLPQLRDLVVLKRNDVGDATHEHIESSNKYYRGFKDYFFGGVEWILVDIIFPQFLKPINKEMTWQDALDAVKGGKSVEVKNISWFDINDLKLGQIKRGKEFRLKPKTTHIDGGNYTKEELLKIAGEME